MQSVPQDSGTDAITVIVQARMTSTRLPGKVLREVRGRTLLERLLLRLRRVGVPHRVVVATTRNATDDRLAEVAASLGAEVYRGSEEDVLRRYAEAAAAHPGDPIARVTADCPLLDPEVTESVFRAFLGARPMVDYAANTLTRTFPRGLDVEVLSHDALSAAHREASAAADREHVTSYIYRHPNRFRLLGVRADADFSDHRWTVDTEADLEFVRAVVDELEPANPDFGWRDVLELVAARPEIRSINAAVPQKPLA